jgi:hypothetical protein
MRPGMMDRAIDSHPLAAALAFWVVLLGALLLTPGLVFAAIVVAVIALGTFG